MKIAVAYLTLIMLAMGCVPTSEGQIPAPPLVTEAPAAPAEPSVLPLSAPGPHLVGWRRNVQLESATRADRALTLTLWYPAVVAEGSEPWTGVGADAAPDLDGAPYPLVLTATKLGIVLAPHLASYGFVVAGVNGQDSSESFGPWLTDHPRDLLLALDALAAEGVSGLEGMIDSDHAGAMGYSFGGPAALFLGGARVDPEGYLKHCAEAASMTPAPQEWWIDYNCNMLSGWEAFVANAAPASSSVEDGLWAPITDERIRAVIPMVPEGAWLFGERGLAKVDRPTMLFGATEDIVNFYDLEAVPIFEGLPPAQRIMISFVGEGHMMIDNAGRLAQMQHFTAAFFSLHLKGDESQRAHLSQEFVAQYPDLGWGAYNAK